MSIGYNRIRQERTAERVQRRSASSALRLTRMRNQLLGAMLIGVVLPASVRSAFDAPYFFNASMSNAVIGTLAAMLIGFFALRRIRDYPGVQPISLVLPTFAATYAVVALAFLLLRLEYSRFQFLGSFLLTAAWFFYLAAVEKNGERKRLLLLPFGSAARLIEHKQIDWLLARHDLQMSLPFSRNLRRSSDYEDAEWVGDAPPAELPENVTGVVADLHADLPIDWEKFLARCALNSMPVYHSKQVAESLSGTVQIEHLSENTFGTLLPSSVYFRIKRTLDMAVAMAVMPVALVIMGLAALAIKLDDGGPVLFRQVRIGHRGKPFEILKLRTMRNGGPPGELFTRQDDARITRVGAYLRLYRIDELPQIFNILRGDMSWIGPRPEAHLLSHWYEAKIPFYSYRHIVRPGITGWAQVNQGNVAQIGDAIAKLHYDFYYIKNFSPWLDLLISAKTIRILFDGFGAR